MSLSNLGMQVKGQMAAGRGKVYGPGSQSSDKGSPQNGGVIRPSRAPYLHTYMFKDSRLERPTYIRGLDEPGSQSSDKGSPKNGSY